ncbi:DUF1624 domain-containing protein [Segetibacter koreensis]|uniref:DUF1624 domain-containing protein n=1 Tax=Segetibacter koreensis TaxID=398037 RepID=UPI0003715D0C|nr:heparan-alpha-glucosaminide N-acetyltransferase domain-containing protein [Segetibacter koreensis]
MKRLQSIDIVRGIIMIIMALDHTRDLIHITSVTNSPTDLQTTTPALFLTRWITHFCAPTFVFLSGVSAYLSLKKNDIKSTRRFLLTRGVWLIILEFTLVNFGVWFDPHFSAFIFDVIAAIGVGFIILSLFLNASTKTILITGLAIIFLHNLSSFIPATGALLPGKIAMMLVAPGAIPFGKRGLFIMGYPPIPWLGVMLVGFAAGRLFELPVLTRKPLFLKIGLAALVLFIIVRSLNIYGDAVQWAQQKSSLFTVLSFINVTKYPPSLVFCLLTLGVMFLLLSAVEGLQNKFTEITIVYGKVPLFFFLIHWYILHPLMFLIIFLQGYKYSDLVFGMNLGRPKGASGLSLAYIYLIWLMVVIMLYPICRWYGNYKESHREKKWLRYL